VRGKKTPEVEHRLKTLVEPETGGDPATGRRFVRLSLRELSRRMHLAQGTVSRLLGKLGFSLRVNVKRFTGPPHPDRDRQFRYLRRQRRAFQRAGDPVISVDTKKKELIGEFKNPGRTWRRTPQEVNAHDFPQDAECRAAPYGLYDVTHNRGHLHVGTSSDTPQFAVDAIRQWWHQKGCRKYPRAQRLLIEADAGGSNGCRPRLWKHALQQWADTDGLTITVAHYPTGASKWNSVEHRLFGPISINWAGEPLSSLAKTLALIRGTRTQTGLTVTASCTHKHYPTKIKVSNHDFAQLNIRHHSTCPDWNYTITPRAP
jgi:hypothetical protein